MGLVQGAPHEDTTLRISPSRLRADFDALAEIGATGDGGVHRPTFSEAHLAARAWLREQIAKAGLECHVDGAGIIRQSPGLLPRALRRFCSGRIWTLCRTAAGSTARWVYCVH